MTSILDSALRAAVVAMLLVLAAALGRDVRSSVAGRLAVALALGTIAHTVSFNIGIAAATSISHAPLVALSSGNVVVLWLFCRALFDDAFLLRPRHALIWLAVSGFSLANCLIVTSAGGTRLAIIAGNLIALGFIGLALAQTVRSWSIDLVEGRRRLRAFIAAVALLYGGTNALLQIAVSSGGTGAFANAVNAALLALVVAAIAVTSLQVGARDVFVSAPQAAVAPRAEANGADQKLIEALTQLMNHERIYRQENVTIGSLAARLAIPEYRLRRLINQRLGYRNFNAFLNNHRIEEAKAALADPTQAEVPVITIAMDAGFQSLGPFNRAFKATTGVTPSEYRRLKVAAA